jgi:hypothetical protein
MARPASERASEVRRIRVAEAESNVRYGPVASAKLRQCRPDPVLFEKLKERYTASGKVPLDSARFE